MMTRVRAAVLGYFAIPLSFAVGNALTKGAFTRLGIFSRPLQAALIVLTALLLGTLLTRSTAVRVSPMAAVVGIVVGFVLWFGMHALLGRLWLWTPLAGQITF